MSDRPVVLEDLSVRYGKVAAVDRVSLAVEKGAVYALLGRNGAGKSSLVRCLMGQQKPSAGRALLAGHDAWTARRQAMAVVGFVPEEPDAPPEMTAAAIARFCARFHPRWDEAGVSARLARFRVPAGVPFGRLSKGQKAEVMLALALGARPPVLILDDPTLGLDVVARREMYEELIGELADRGSTILLTTHDLEGVERIASRVGVMREGRLVLDEELESLKGRFRSLTYRRGKAGAANGELKELDAAFVRTHAWGIEALVARFDEAALERFRLAAEATDLEVKPVSLEAIFTAMVGEGPGRRPS